jgi:hypothetical protein
MREVLTVLMALLLFVGGLVVVLWPLRAITQSAKVRGLWKLAWVGLWFAAFLLGGLVSSAFMPAMRRSDSPIFMALMPLAGLIPIWGVFFLFRARTRHRPDLESRTESFGFALGKQVRHLFARPK